jgi:hypothetical protein
VALAQRRVVEGHAVHEVEVAGVLGLDRPEGDCVSNRRVTSTHWNWQDLVRHR